MVLSAFFFVGISLWPLNNFLWTHDWQQYYALGVLTLFLGLPLVGFLIWLVRRILGVQTKSNFLRWSFGLLWAAAWVLVVLFIASISRDFQFYEHVSVVVPIATQPEGGRMLVAVSEPVLAADTHRFWWLDEASEGWDISEDDLKLSFVQFRIKPSKDGLYRVSIDKSSAGKSRNDAVTRANQISYRALYSAGTLDLANSFSISTQSKYRGQMITVDIQVPVGKKIRLDDSIKDKLNPVNFKIERGHGWRNRRIVINLGDDYDSMPWQTNVDYTMGKDGELRTFAPSP